MINIRKAFGFCGQPNLLLCSGYLSSLPFLAFTQII